MWSLWAPYRIIKDYSLCFLDQYSMWFLWSPNTQHVKKTAILLDNTKHEQLLILFYTFSNFWHKQKSNVKFGCCCHLCGFYASHVETSVLWFLTAPFLSLALLDGMTLTFRRLHQIHNLETFIFPKQQICHVFHFKLLSSSMSSPCLLWWWLLLYSTILHFWANSLRSHDSTWMTRFL